ncbi:MAG: hypothetical protein E6R03_08895 [Hyphomicrobiaceae bacterium]|nr:MAG: hypothetical protein E6R03_08895 [Hyphomicrobiaceae bacterium]
MSEELTELPSDTSLGNVIGQILKPVYNPGARMGSWTGLRPLYGAPLSGALWGAGLGGLYGLGRAAVRGIKGETEEEPEPWWANPLLVGALSGAALGSASGLAQEKTSSFYDQNRLLELIQNNPSITDFEKKKLIDLVHEADQPQLSRMLSLAAAGALTAAAAHTILGTGAFKSSILGGLGAFAISNFFPGKPRYV